MFDPITFLMECLVFDWLCLRNLDIGYINHSLTSTLNKFAFSLTRSLAHSLTSHIHSLSPVYLDFRFIPNMCVFIPWGLFRSFLPLTLTSVQMSLPFWHSDISSTLIGSCRWEWNHHWYSTGTLAWPCCYSSLPTVTAQCWSSYDVITLSIRA